MCGVFHYFVNMFINIFLNMFVNMLVSVFVNMLQHWHIAHADPHEGRNTPASWRSVHVHGHVW